MEDLSIRFDDLLRSTGREGIEELIAWLGNVENDWYVAPASSKYHGNYSGGLLEHSLAVYDELERIAAVYQKEVPLAPESRIIMALLHDLCKINTYKQVEKFRKNEFGSWEKYLAYEHDESYKFGGHGSKSVYLASQFIKLTPVEAAAINCHMATWEEGRIKETSQVYTRYPAAWMLHVADEAATFVDKK